MNIIQRIKQTASQLVSLIKSIKINPDQDTVIFDCGDFEITKREIIVSFSIVALMLIFGFSISGYIADKVEDKKRMYNQALQIDSKDMFEYGMSTNVGNAFVYGELKAVDTVAYEEIEGAYLWIEKEREEYTRHEREVEHTDSEGHKYYTTEVYYTWDSVWSESKHSEKITFLGVEFDYSKINVNSSHYIDTIYKSMDVRYIYRGIDPEHTGTIFTKLADGTIEDDLHFYENETIAQVLESKSNDDSQIIFWILWIILIIAAVGGFYYFDNSWLD